MSRGSRNWARVHVSLSSDDAAYLLGLISADLGAMWPHRDKWALQMGRAQRTRQKLQDAMKGGDRGTGKDKVITLRD